MANLAELLGNRLRTIRKAKGLRQEDLEQLGISYKYYQRIENGKANVTLATIEKLADALGVDPTEILFMPFSGSEEENELAARFTDLIKSKEKEKIKKLLHVIDHIL